MYKYKTKDGSTGGFLPGVGEIVDGTITSTHPIENPNLELVNETTDSSPAHVAGVAPQAQQPAAAPQPSTAEKESE